MTTTSGNIKTYILIVFFVLQATLISCTKETEFLESQVSPGKPIKTPFPSLIPNQKPSSMPLVYPTITPTHESKRNEIYFDEQGLTWIECNVSDSQYQKWRFVERCLGISLPAWEESDRLRLGERIENELSSFEDFRIRIGEDTYETKNHPSNGMHEFVLLKNGIAFAAQHARFTTYNPNRALLNVGGISVWELADHSQPTIFYNGKNIVEIFNLDAAFIPYEINGKLIYTAKKNGKYLVVYDGKQLGPVFDEVSVGYCCVPAGYSIQRVQEQYWFWGIRDDEYYVVAILK